MTGLNSAGLSIGRFLQVASRPISRTRFLLLASKCWTIGSIDADVGVCFGSQSVLAFHGRSEILEAMCYGNVSKETKQPARVFPCVFSKRHVGVL
eukprot:1583060-Rhodomonas_salina.3